MISIDNTAKNSSHFGEFLVYAPVKKTTVLFAILIFCSAAYADAKKNLFYIKRNKNRNQVHYAIRYDEATCKPVGSDPLYGYWINYEVSPTDYEPIGRFEAMAYGIQSQNLQGNDLTVQLKAFPDRKVRITFDNSAGCKITPYILIASKEAILKEISVFAIEGLITPTVKYIDISGIIGAVPITERINK